MPALLLCCRYSHGYGHILQCDGCTREWIRPHAVEAMCKPKARLRQLLWDLLLDLLEMTSSRTFNLIVFCSGLVLAPLLVRSPIAAQPQASPPGAQIFAANCGACHGSDGRGGERAPNIATRRVVVSLSDSDLIHIVQNGISGTGMPAFGSMGEDKVKDVVSYLRTLQGMGGTASVSGDPSSGEALFYGRAGCSGCHMVNGRGGFMGADLTGYGQGRTPSAVRGAIVSPDASSDREGQEVTVATKKGSKLHGLIRSQDNFYVVLQTEDGAFHTFARDQIARLDYSGHSLMPQDYGTKLNSKELDDLVSYLYKSDAKERVAKEDDED